MFEKEIEFSAHENYFFLKEDYPTPIKLNIPEWFKQLKHEANSKTVKGCMPFLNTLTTGYLLKTPQEFLIEHNVDNINQQGEKFKDGNFEPALKNHQFYLQNEYINLNSSFVQVHQPKQLKGSPLVEKNKNLPFLKILNPWKIRTPNGYSCLFVPPLNNSDDRFSIIPGIVDTDTFKNEINFPIVINGDKYPSLRTVIDKGTPYVQVIPFKRDDWKMKLKPRKKEDIVKINVFYDLKSFKNYATNYWNKNSWK
jgi:hypothetical protein